MNKKHWAIFITNESNKTAFINSLLKGHLPDALEPLRTLNGALFSKLTIERFMLEEDIHGTKIITKNTKQALKSMSSGEQKKALLNHLLRSKPDYIILDNPFDNLDAGSQTALARTLEKTAAATLFILLISRKNDLLSFFEHYASLEGSRFTPRKDLKFLSDYSSKKPFQGKIPEPLHKIPFESNELVSMKKVSIRFGEKTVLQNIDWTIKKGEFWQLIGKNGSGKTTLLSMLTGENPKGYGQDLFLFGTKKGSGESIWDIKQRIGYFTPAMTDKFTGHHSIENMLISGLTDSIGLYTRPSAAQKRLAKEWLILIEMWPLRDKHFHDLSMGQKRLVMTVRAMIKHPLLLILDEPTAGLDDASATLLVALVNKIARESNTATIFVSHRKESGLEPDKVFELQMTHTGSLGIVS